MDLVYQVFWAKKSDRTGIYKWLPLYQHLEDTRQVAGFLWEHWLSHGQREWIRKLFPDQSDEKSKELVQFLASVHDLGKATPAFQTKKSFINSTDLDFQLIEKLECAGFEGITHLGLANTSSTPHALASQYIISHFGVNEDVASIVGAHHGKPVNSKQTILNQRAYLSNYYQIEHPDNSVHIKWKTAQEALFRWALKVNGFETVADLPEIPQPVQVILSGLLIMSDWIASNEHYFPLIAIDETEVCFGEERYQKGWESWQKADIWEPTGYKSVEDYYEDRFDFLPRNVQEAFSKVIENTEYPGIVILEAPMGIGKTEAAFVGVEQLAAKTGRSGMFFGLPTQATSNGIFSRVLDWLENVQSEEGNTASLRLAHGKSALNEQFATLSQNINIDDANNGGVIVNEWFAGRKTSALDDFVVGTVDHFLLLALKQKHLALRHLGFSKKVVVIDEVHAYDAYMNQYLLRAIRWMGAYEVPVIILSATLPTKKREEMIQAYLRGKGVGSKAVTAQIDELHATAYPLVTYSDGELVKQQVHFKSGDQKSVEIIRENSENLYNRLDQLTEDDGVVGIVVNTVKRAQAMAIECALRYGEDLVELLHSSFIATDRAKKEEVLIARIGKGANRPKKKIIIGTQVIEQSLDIDFDVLFSDLAPIDLLIQRIGRLHRHDIDRPQHHRKPRCYVLDTDDAFDFEKGSVAVYGGYLLARTQMLLPEHIMLPDDISPLVQQVYGDEPIILPEELEESYEKMKAEHEDLLEKKADKAKVYCIDVPKRARQIGKKPSLMGWLEYSTPNETEERVYAQVRDTQETIEVIALKKIGEGYGIFGEEEDLSHREGEAQVAKRLAQQTLRLPNPLSAPYCIDATIRELEDIHSRHFSHWHDQPWLKGQLGLLFDENSQSTINGYLLQYDGKYGLTYERM